MHDWIFLTRSGWEQYTRSGPLPGFRYIAVNHELKLAIQIAEDGMPYFKDVVNHEIEYDYMFRNKYFEDLDSHYLQITPEQAYELGPSPQAESMMRTYKESWALDE